MKRLAKAAIVVSLAVGATSAMAQASSAYPMGSSAYYEELNSSPAATVYSNPTDVTDSSSAQFRANADRSSYPEGASAWSNYVRGEPQTYESDNAASNADAWPESADGGPSYWTTHGYGGKPLAGTEDAAREQQRQAQLQRLHSGS